MKLLTNKH